MDRPTSLDDTTATAILGIDTLWGGDVLAPSGTARFIADSWFSDRPLPLAYTHPAAARLRETGGVAADRIDAPAVDAYLAVVDVAGAVASLGTRGRDLGGLRGAYLSGVATSLEVMWDLAQELLGRGSAVSYSRCVNASCGRLPGPSSPGEKLARVSALLARAGHPASTPAGMLASVDAWRAARLVPARSVRQLSDAFVAQLDEGTRRHVLPHLPASLHGIPRANVRFLPLDGATFSGSMNYLGRARDAAGAPLYDATYELNTSLQISVPEFADLVAHEVVPGHTTTFALLQALYVQGRVGFEASVLTMNTLGATLFEGIANNAILLAHGVKEVGELPDEDLQLGMLLALLQDDAKNQASWLTWGEGRPEGDVAAALRSGYLVSEERAGKLAGPWARHPLLGRMYLPAYRAGTERVGELLRTHPWERLVPALYGVHGLVDLVTIDRVL
jgi:hypothetical protein